LLQFNTKQCYFYDEIVSLANKKSIIFFNVSTFNDNTWKKKDVIVNYLVTINTKRYFYDEIVSLANKKSIIFFNVSTFNDNTWKKKDVIVNYLVTINTKQMIVLRWNCFFVKQKINKFFYCFNFQWQYMEKKRCNCNLQTTKNINSLFHLYFRTYSPKKKTATNCLTTIIEKFNMTFLYTQYNLMELQKNYE
jgi:hypothetical protein